MNKGRFSRVEERIEQLVEGTFARLFAGRLQPREVAVHLARALEDNAIAGVDGVLFAPNTFRVCLHADDHAAITDSEPHLIDLLAETVIDLANRAGMRLMENPLIELVADDTVALHVIVVTAHYEDRSKGATQSMQPIAMIPAEEPRSIRNAYLIMNGTRYIPLDRPVINIGRRHDNQIVIDDPRVSRRHSQLRLRFGHYVIYDLGSSGGTYVNDHRVQESIVKPGDVLSLAGVKMVYIEDESSTTGRSSPEINTKTEIDAQRPTHLKKREKDDDPTL